jgi:hypothetical protein
VLPEHLKIVPGSCMGPFELEDGLGAGWWDPLQAVEYRIGEALATGGEPVGVVPGPGLRGDSQGREGSQWGPWNGAALRSGTGGFLRSFGAPARSEQGLIAAFDDWRTGGCSIAKGVGGPGPLGATNGSFKVVTSASAFGEGDAKWGSCGAPVGYRGGATVGLWGPGRAWGLRYRGGATVGLWGPGRAWGLRYRGGATVGLWGPGRDWGLRYRLGATVGL